MGDSRSRSSVARSAWGEGLPSLRRRRRRIPRLADALGSTGIAIELSYWSTVSSLAGEKSLVLVGLELLRGKLLEGACHGYPLPK